MDMPAMLIDSFARAAGKKIGQKSLDKDNKHGDGNVTDRLLSNWFIFPF